MLKPFRALWRRLFQPDLPWWESSSTCSIRFRAAILGCSLDEVIENRRVTLEWHHQRWLAGEKF